ncbi:MAG: nucleotidyltransferase domain-containing protein [Candidatus Cloacimonadota bacterium]|nr:nucleotidyltransferase domain-containing protein [Candidatus Cloacimonadota bacterium]
MITEKQINEIVKRIVENYFPERIILFGSYAYGSPTKDSDLDLLIVKESNIPIHKRGREVRKYLRGLKVPMDIIIRTPAEFETYKDIIGTIIYPANKFGKVIYES